MSTSLSEFLAERAEKLAFLQLTRRNDLIVSRLGGRESGLDFLVTLGRGGVRSVRVFGVQVKAAEGSVNNPATLASLSEPPAASEAPFPLCRFLFTMSDDQGYYLWVTTPAVPARENSAGASEWRKLDDQALACIVDSVNAWYAARLQPQAA